MRYRLHCYRNEGGVWHMAGIRTSQQYLNYEDEIYGTLPSITDRSVLQAEDGSWIALDELHTSKSMEDAVIGTFPTYEAAKMAANLL